MKGLREKFRNKKGFTLIEMLIVVAIIAILVAVSIPVVNNALDKAKEETDNANLRSAAALATITYLTDGNNSNVNNYFYMVSDKGSQGTLTNKASDKDSCYKCQYGADKGKYIKITCTDEGKVTVDWDATGPADT